MDSLISPLIWNFHNSSVPYGMNKSWRKNNEQQNNRCKLSFFRKSKERQYWYNA